MGYEDIHPSVYYCPRCDALRTLHYHPEVPDLGTPYPFPKVTVCAADGQVA